MIFKRIAYMEYSPTPNIKACIAITDVPLKQVRANAITIYTKMKKHYPNLKYITSTNREIISSSTNKLTGYLYTDRLYTSETYVLEDIVDRVGGGDAYFAGILYGIIHGMSMQDTFEFGCCSSALKHTVHGDINAFSAEEIDALRKNGITRINS